MFTVYIDEKLDNKSTKEVKGTIPIPCGVFNARKGNSVIITEEGGFPFALGNNLATYALEKRYGIVEPGLFNEGCVAPDASLTKEDIENYIKGWL